MRADWKQTDIFSQPDKYERLSSISTTFLPDYKYKSYVEEKKKVYNVCWHPVIIIYTSLLKEDWKRKFPVEKKSDENKLKLCQ
jgi:hypothetical protein